MGCDILSYSVSGIPRSEDCAVKFIRSETFVEVGSLHRRFHVSGGEHLQRGSCHSLKFLPEAKSPIRVHLVVLSSTIDFLEVLGDCLVHMVAFGYKLLLFDHGPQNWVPKLNLRNFSAVA